MHQGKARAASSRRMMRETRTIEVMAVIYCRGVHRRGDILCQECTILLDYALTRLERCPFKDDKPACGSCPVHCYKPEMREKIRAVMRYAGPRMFVRHPVLAFLHLLDALRKVRR